MIDFVMGERPWAVDVDARPTTSIIGIVRVMKEQIGDLIVRARFGGLPEGAPGGREHIPQRGLGP